MHACTTNAPALKYINHNSLRKGATQCAMGVTVGDDEKTLIGKSAKAEG